MTHVFLTEGREAIRALATRSILYAFAFDGTLARISSDDEGIRATDQWGRHRMCQRSG